MGCRYPRDPQESAVLVFWDLYWSASIRANPRLIFIDFVGGPQLPDVGKCGVILQPVPNHQNR
jgi:hypothetical protein